MSAHSVVEGAAFDNATWSHSSLDAAKQSGRQGKIHYKNIEMNGLYGDCVEMPDDWEAYEA